MGISKGMTRPDDDEWLDRKAAEAYLGFADRSLITAARRGLVAFEHRGRFLYFSRTALDTYKSKTRVGGTAACRCCREEFVREKGGQVYCSRLCQNRAANRRRLGGKNDGSHFEKRCARCGKSFVAKHFALYCTDECRNDAARQMEKGRPANYGAVKHCAECNEEFEARSRMALYCGSRCETRARRKRQKGVAA